jgi:hypothetical protein
MNLNLHPFTEARLKKILALYADDERFAQQIIAYQEAQLRQTLLSIRLDLQTFEKQYQMDSEEFYRRFQNGELGDTEDFMLWAGSYELLYHNQVILNEFSYA